VTCQAVAPPPGSAKPPQRGPRGSPFGAVRGRRRAAAGREPRFHPPPSDQAVGVVCRVRHIFHGDAASPTSAPWRWPLAPPRQPKRGRDGSITLAASPCPFARATCTIPSRYRIYRRPIARSRLTLRPCPGGHVGGVLAG
jgi:hypothetical protein